MTTRAKQVTITAAFLLISCGIAGVFWWRFFEPMHLRIRLLCKTDHQTLLEACRQLSNQVIADKLQAGSYQIRPWMDFTASRFPRAIRALGPTYAYVDKDGRIMIEMFGGLSHFGVYAYPEDYKEPFPGFKYGDRELLPGLWYYDDDYVKYPDFDATITALMDTWK